MTNETKRPTNADNLRVIARRTAEQLPRVVTHDSIRANFATGAVAQRRMVAKAEANGGMHNGYSIERLKATEADYLRLSMATDEALDAHMAAMKAVMSTRLDALKAVTR
jgi:histidinol-phosphate/aromatic aminotransferase/cobyric acid decarboxylase-like protein